MSLSMSLWRKIVWRDDKSAKDERNVCSMFDTPALQEVIFHVNRFYVVRNRKPQVSGVTPMLFWVTIWITKMSSCLLISTTLSRPFWPQLTYRLWSHLTTHRYASKCPTLSGVLLYLECKKMLHYRDSWWFCAPSVRCVSRHLLQWNAYDWLRLYHQVEKECWWATPWTVPLHLWLGTSGGCVADLWWHHFLRNSHKLDRVSVACC